LVAFARIAEPRWLGMSTKPGGIGGGAASWALIYAPSGLGMPRHRSVGHAGTSISRAGANAPARLDARDLAFEVGAPDQARCEDGGLIMAVSTGFGMPSLEWRQSPLISE
jgi:hypothetical protein